MEKEKSKFIIRKTKKKINPTGTAYDSQELYVEAETKKEAEEMFDKHWEE